LKSPQKIIYVRLIV